MTKSKNPNPIEEAVGDRTKTTQSKSSPKKTKEQLLQEAFDIRIPPDLEALNQQTEERLLGNQEELLKNVIPVEKLSKKETTIPVLKPDPQPATETSSQESQPPQNSDSLNYYICPDCAEEVLNIGKLNHQCAYLEAKGVDTPTSELLNRGGPIQEYTQEDVDDAQKATEENNTLQMNCQQCVPAEERELTALKEYILDNGFNAAGVAMHIVMLCAQPMVTPSTTTWDFKDRANVPELVLNVLKAPGYIEGIWPSLRVVMGTNKGNAAWTAGICTTIAFFDVIRSLPILKELENDS